MKAKRFLPKDRIPLGNEIPSETLCADCGEHEATVKFTESVFEANHFGTTPLCRHCFVERRIEYLDSIMKGIYEGMRELVRFKEGRNAD